MLCYDPSARITAQEILNHPWITMVTEETDQITETSDKSSVTTIESSNESNNVNNTTVSSSSLPPPTSTSTPTTTTTSATTTLPQPPNITETTILSSNTTTLTTEFTPSNENVVHNVSIVPPLPIIRPTMTRRQSASSTQLNGALRKLTGHVQERKLEKMTTTITRFMSTMQLQKKQNLENTSNNTRNFPIVNSLRSRLKQRLGRGQNETSTPIGTPTGAGTGTGADDVNEEELSAAVTESITNMISSEVRDLILKIFFGIGQGQNTDQNVSINQNNNLDGNISEVGKLTVEQFAQILSDILEVSGAPIIMISRFIDADNDGFITAEDIFLAETKMIHRSPDFLKIFFSFYTDALWYPGRNINHMNLGLPVNTIGNNIAKGTTVLKNMLTGDAPLQMFEAPKYITGIIIIITISISNFIVVL